MERVLKAERDGNNELMQLEAEVAELKKWLQVHRVEEVSESGGLRWMHLQRGDVLLGQIRNPFEWYASLWAYLLNGMSKPAASNNTDRPSYGTTEAERIQFRKWVRDMTEPHLGLLSVVRGAGISACPVSCAHPSYTHFERLVSPRPRAARVRQLHLLQPHARAAANHRASQ